MTSIATASGFNPAKYCGLLLLIVFCHSGQATSQDQPFVVYMGSAERIIDRKTSTFINKIVTAQLTDVLSECGLKAEYLRTPRARAKILHDNDEIDFDMIDAPGGNLSNEALMISTPIVEADVYVWAGTHANITSEHDLKNYTGVLVNNLWLNHKAVVEGTYGDVGAYQPEKTIEVANTIGAFKLLHSGRADYIVWGNLTTTEVLHTLKLDNIRRVTAIEPRRSALYSWLPKRHAEYQACIETLYAERFPPQLPGGTMEDTDWCAPHARNHSDEDC